MRDLDTLKTVATLINVSCQQISVAKVSIFKISFIYNQWQIIQIFDLFEKCCDIYEYNLSVNVSVRSVHFQKNGLYTTKIKLFRVLIKQKL